MTVCRSSIVSSADVLEGESIDLVTMTPDGLAAMGELIGTVIEARPRSVRIELEAVRGSTRRLWLPRRALVKLRRDRGGIRGQLARWWTPDDYQAAIVDRCRHPCR